MGFNPASLPGDVLDRVFKGLESQDGALVDRLGVKIPVRQLSGTLPALPSVNTLGRPSDTGLAEGAEAKPFSAELNTDTVYALKRYVGIGEVPDGVRVELDALGMQTLSWYMQRAKAEQDAKINAAYDAVLKSTSLNLEQAVTNGAWSSSSSNPIEDFQAALRKCGKGDTIVLGDDVVDDLSVHPDMTSRLSNYSGGGLSEGELLEVLRRLFKSVKKIVLGTNLYNSATEGQDATIAYQFDGLAWVGHERDIIIPHMSTGSETEQYREAKKECTGVRNTRRLSIERPNRDTGCVITGI